MVAHGPLCAAIGVAATLVAVVPVGAQGSPYEGLPAGVVSIASAVRTGDVEAILRSLPRTTEPGPVVRTAFPGDGENVSLETAQRDIRALIASDATRSDSFGSGKYTLLAVWLPAIKLGLVILAGSGIGPDGVRISTGFSVEAVTSGGYAITAFGRILDLDATLTQWDGQGDLRRVSAQSPGPPGTGSGQPTIPSRPLLPPAVAAALGMAIASAGAYFLLGARRAR